ncbi:pyrimidine-nucleoside phosphorylase [Paenibacillus hemerocallicola]|uniref:Pyrimidine-nucleoside phosphorylase n=1 Tax=Paenibacillus hemerocallicola TaxID=1172614 RepID=A0A5C4TFE4_9BACL|nr:pyrimidine-nucleoside phosphorylase [Paenibacillus hemerocallicola]TNJ67376.1 pyrimidine-nucleoside phosphorylase [Paenibacillus hemerocallicola]
MRMVDLIQHKRDGGRLTREQIYYAVQGFTRGDIPDYQMSAFAMAVFFRGMDEEEIADLTMAMVNSGDVVSLAGITGIKVDKHSTGGVGDKTSLIVVPLVAAAGVPVAKMSGRGLGHTGGTVDKLESIRGFRIELPNDRFVRNVNENKMALVGQSGNLAPADKKLYALRDVTATVNSIPLIASSIMSKKIASGADAIVLDVKVGSGAFMKSYEDAKALASTMVSIGKSLKRRTIAVLSDMSEPLGTEVGNANEVAEAIEVLRGGGDTRLREICLTLAAYMTVAGGAYGNYDEARRALDELLHSGRAVETFRKFVEAQGGDPAIVDDPGLLPQAAVHVSVRAEREGFVQSIDAETVGVTAMLLGAGRATKEDSIDYSVGISLRKKVGDPVKFGDVIAVIHSNREQNQDIAERLIGAYTIVSDKPEPVPVVHSVIE